MLEPGETLRVRTKGGETVFSSGGRWLHPLFDLTDFLGTRPDLAPGDLDLTDRVLGRGAAFLVVRLGIRTVAAGVVSRRAIPVFEAHGTGWTAGQVVDRIDCRTEDLLAGVDDLDQAWDILAARRRPPVSVKSPSP